MAECFYSLCQPESDSEADYERAMAALVVLAEAVADIRLLRRAWTE